MQPNKWNLIKVISGSCSSEDNMFSVSLASFAISTHNPSYKKQKLLTQIKVIHTKQD